MRVHNWLHRRGWARRLNTCSYDAVGRCSTYIETRGPRWLGERLWRYVLRSSGSYRPDWLTVRVERVEQLSRFRWRWLIFYRAVRG